MRHFFTKNTVEATIWCKVCGKATPHHIDDGRPTYCITCMNQPKPEAKPPAAVQEGLFK